MKLVLLLLLVGCARTPVLEVVVTKVSTVTLAKAGKLSVRLEIRRLGTEANAIAVMTWAGSDAASLDSSIQISKLTQKFSPLKSNSDTMEFQHAQTRITSTPVVLEPDRLCSTLALAVSSFNVNAEEIVQNAVLEACEKP